MTVSAPLGHTRLRVWGGVMLVWAIVDQGCAEGSGASHATTARDAHAEAAPSLRALPELEGGSVDTPRTHQGLLLARETFDTVLPDAPSDRTYASLQRWVDGAVASWVEHRREQIDTTRSRFEAGGAQSEAEQVVSHAVVGLLDEDTALALGRLPSPSELDDEPEIAAMYRDMMRAQADVFVRSALRELADCANQGYGGPSDLRPWAEVCHARFDHLQAQISSRETMRPLQHASRAQ
ncbi:MAG: hypothetical protein ACHQ53_14690 [Polyangiales bacterium]